MKRRIKVFLVLFLILFSGTTVQGNTTKEVNRYLSETASYLVSHNPNPSMGSVGGEWLIMGLARSEKIQSAYGEKYKENLGKIVQGCQGKLSDRKTTEFSRVIIALTAIKENPQNIQGYNLLKPLAEFDGITRQGANGVIYGLIALDSGNYEIPEADGNYRGEVTTREKLITRILEAELSDGGWAFSGKKADADMTAMALQALAPYYKTNGAVKKAVDRGLECLSQMQLSDGTFETGTTKTCESTAQVLTAISEMRISIYDKRFVKNGKTVFDGLLSYYKNGSFMHMQGGEANEMATEQAYYAMTALYRNLAGKNRLYEMSDAEKLKEPASSQEKQKDTKKNQAKNSGKPATHKSSQKVQEKNTEGIPVTTKKTEEVTEEGTKKKEALSKTETETTSETVRRDESLETEETQQETESCEETERKTEASGNAKTPYIIVFVLVMAGGGSAYALRTRRGMGLKER